MEILNYNFLLNDKHHFGENHIYPNQYYNELINAFNNWNENHFSGESYLKLIPFIIKYNSLVIEGNVTSIYAKYDDEFKNILISFVKLSNYTFKKFKYSQKISSNIITQFPQLEQILNKYNLSL